MRNREKSTWQNSEHVYGIGEQQKDRTMTAAIQDTLTQEMHRVEREECQGWQFAPASAITSGTVRRETR